MVQRVWLNKWCQFGTKCANHVKLSQIVATRTTFHTNYFWNKLRYCVYLLFPLLILSQFFFLLTLYINRYTRKKLFSKLSAESNFALCILICILIYRLLCWIVESSTIIIMPPKNLILWKVSTLFIRENELFRKATSRCNKFKFWKFEMFFFIFFIF